MERALWYNLNQSKWVWGSFIFGSWFLQKTVYRNQLVYHEVFGLDGNGGSMLKIITNLTDEEMARLKFVRRLSWHWKGTRRNISENAISD